MAHVTGFRENSEQAEFGVSLGSCMGMVSCYNFKGEKLSDFLHLCHINKNQMQLLLKWTVHSGWGHSLASWLLLMSSPGRICFCAKILLSAWFQNVASVKNKTLNASAFATQLHYEACRRVLILPWASHRHRTYTEHFYCQCSEVNNDNDSSKCTSESNSSSALCTTHGCHALTSLVCRCRWR